MFTEKWVPLDLKCLHKWVILHMPTTVLLSYLSCKKREEARTSGTLLSVFLLVLPTPLRWHQSVTIRKKNDYEK
jgi:hypothetical protein